MKELEDLKSLLARIPSVGNKAAAKMINYFLENPGYVDKLGFLLKDLSKVKKCKKCFNYTLEDYCNICTDASRDKNIVCIVEKQSDIDVFEDSGYNGLYYVLGALLSPIDGIGPDSLKLDYLVERMKQEGISEILFALKSNMEGNTTSIYIKKTLEEQGCKISFSRLALGIQFGKEVSSLDKLTAKEALIRRIGF